MFSEINWANKRMTALMLSYGVAESDRAPDTYAEFLLRSRITSSTNQQPAAAARAARSGNNVRLAALPGSTGQLAPAMASTCCCSGRPDRRYSRESGHVPAVDADGHDPAPAVLPPAGCKPQISVVDRGSAVN